MDKSPREKSAYREMLTKNLGEENETFEFQSTKHLISTGSDEKREENEKETTPEIQPKSTRSRIKDLVNYKTLFYTLLIGFIGSMAVALYDQNGELGTINGNISGIREDIVKLETTVNAIREKYEGNTLIQKDLEYIKTRLNFIESKLRF
jgi:hypothetical protein